MSFEDDPCYGLPKPSTTSETIEKVHEEWIMKVTRRGLLATDHVILNYGQVTWTIPELSSPLLTTTPHQREDVSALDTFNVHRCPTRRVLSGTRLTCLEYGDKPISWNRKESERSLFRGGCVQSAITLVLLDIFG
ncbi:uncharacterized protein TNCV_3541831 [Trichonephila clavipes]|nr:uncharacterized protein TNCV_3541831 [Trichonephila clavipes]